ncbi:hypothetical protein BXZ70DRAFT_910068 [Cristinia sonorae]|uniref:Uncharacterized protein n=1 Tax=Cristinia sonorae TaxID=1940300 RepID=A0A8K0XLE9_9AGAR|nr:hypothetical protein BXZ70DRAFT_910068 [Cristinia sonorae]
MPFLERDLGNDQALRSLMTFGGSSCGLLAGTAILYCAPVSPLRSRGDSDTEYDHTTKIAYRPRFLMIMFFNRLAFSKSHWNERRPVLVKACKDLSGSSLGCQDDSKMPLQLLSLGVAKISGSSASSSSDEHGRDHDECSSDDLESSSLATNMANAVRKGLALVHQPESDGEGSSKSSIAILITGNLTGTTVSHSERTAEVETVQLMRARRRTFSIKGRGVVQQLFKRGKYFTPHFLASPLPATDNITITTMRFTAIFAFALASASYVVATPAPAPVPETNLCFSGNQIACTPGVSSGACCAIAGQTCQFVARMGQFICVF